MNRVGQQQEYDQLGPNDEGDDDSSTRKKIYACIACVIVLLIVILTCWDSIDPTELGLLCNKLTKQCQKDKAYTSGRHLVGPFQYFLRFPDTLQTIEFSERRGDNINPPLKTRTAEGLALGLSVSFQYRLVQNELPQLYQMNNLQYAQTFVRIARDTILQVAGSYDAPSYWTKRKQIGEEMRNQLDRELKKAHAHCIYLQILQIDLPSQYEQSIVNTQVEVQKRKMKEYEQQAQLILQSIEVMRSQTDMEIKQIDASAQAEAFTIKQNATGKANELTITAETTAYLEAKQLISLSDAELNEYIYYISLMDKQQAKIVVGMDQVIADMRGQQSVLP